MNEQQSADSQSPTPPLQWLTPRRFAVILGLLTFAAFPQVVIGTHSFAYRDYGLFGYPLAHYFRDSFWRGELPLWNAYNEFGTPFLAQWGTMVLYPPSLIYLLLPLPWSLSIFCLLHLFLGGMGMYVLTSRWTGNRLAAGVAGVAFAFSGLVLNCLMWPNYTASLAWMPWVVHAVTLVWEQGNRRLVGASLAGALQMLSGTPEVILFTWLIVAALWLFTRAQTWQSAWSSGWRTMAVVVLVAGLSAAQLLPFFELLSNSQRDTAFEKGVWPLPVWGWANLFVPMFRVFVTGCGVCFQHGQMFTSSIYSGIFIMMLVIPALVYHRDRRVWLFASIAIASIVLAMGHKAGVYPLLRTGLPQIGFMRYTSKFIMLLSFVLPILGAFGLSNIMDGERQSQRLRTMMVAGAAVSVLGIGIIIFARYSPFAAHEWFITFANGSTRIAFLIALSGSVFFLVRMEGSNRQWLFQCLILLLVWLDLLSHVPSQNPTLDREALTVPIPQLQKLSPRPQLGVSRAALTVEALNGFQSAGTSNLTQTFLLMRNGMFANANLVEKIPKADGFYPLSIKEARNVVLRLFRTPHKPREGLGRFVGISQIVSATNLTVWEPRRDYLPMITAGQRPVFANPADTLAGVMATNFAPEAMVFLPEAAREQISATNAVQTRVVSFDVREHSLRAEVEAAGPSLVVIAQAFYPAWRASVDGKPVRLWRANYAFQALEVGGGNHHIEVVYEDRAFWLGALISVLGIGVCLSAHCLTRCKVWRN
jgi:hypothetical protein